jgi:hypothetical protein
MSDVRNPGHFFFGHHAKQFPQIPGHEQREQQRYDNYVIGLENGHFFASSVVQIKYVCVATLTAQFRHRGTGSTCAIFGNHAIAT